MVLSADHTADVMTGVLRRLSMLVTSRYHAAVLSMDAGIPVLGVSMDERLGSLLRELSFEKDYLYSVADAQLGQKLYGAMEHAWQQRADIAALLHTRYSDYLERLSEMGSFLKQYITGRLS